MELSQGQIIKKYKQARVFFLFHDISSQSHACTCKSFHTVKVLWPGHRLLYGTKSRADNSKTNKQALSSFFMTHCLNIMHAPVKFHKYIPYGLGVMARTRFTIWN